MKLGAEPKKVAIFAGLLLLAAIAYFTGGDDRPASGNRVAAPVSPAPAVRPVSGSAGPRTVIPAAAGSALQPNRNRRVTQEFKPVLRPRRVEDRVDPTTIDPTLRNDLLARLANVPIQGGQRSLFEFAAAPVPKAPDPGKIIPAQPANAVKAVPLPPPVPSKPLEAAKPQAPPIPLKFYGFTARAGQKRAFFLENEDVFVAREGEVVRNRYKVVRINLNSVVMEDSEFKQQQTLPLTEQVQ